MWLAVAGLTGSPTTITTVSSPSLVLEHADLVEQMHGTGAIWSLRLGDCDQEQRQALIDHHGRVMRLLRQRGHRVRPGLVHNDDEGECLTLRIVSAPSSSDLTWSVLTQ